MISKKSHTFGDENKADHVNRRRKFVFKYILKNMKNAYLKPMMLVVKIQHSGIICESTVTTLQSNASLNLGGSDASYSGGIRTKESSDIWDDEW